MGGSSGESGDPDTSPSGCFKNNRSVNPSVYVDIVRNLIFDSPILEKNPLSAPDYLLKDDFTEMTSLAFQRRRNVTLIQ